MPASFCVMGSSKRRPIRRLMAKKVCSGLVIAWRLAGCPTRRSPSVEKVTIEGVVRMPSAFSITLGADPSMTAMQEFVVPRSIPITFAMSFLLWADASGPSYEQPKVTSPRNHTKNFAAGGYIGRGLRARKPRRAPILAGSRQSSSYPSLFAACCKPPWAIAKRAP